MRIELRPPAEAAGVALGSTRADVTEHVSRLGKPKEFRRAAEENASLAVQRPSGLSIFVHFDSADRVDAIELGRPDSDDDVVLYGDHDVFGTVAEDLVRRLQDSALVEVAEHGRAVTLPDLLLALWRPVVPEDPADDVGRYFESVLVARPGYYN